MTAQEAPFTAPVPGGEIVGTVWRPGAPGIPLLGLHGITANHRSFRGLADSVANPFIAIDQRGRGGSRDLPGPYALDRLADDARDVLDAAGVDKALVVGHSMGAFVATRLARSFPDRVHGLVLVDGGLPLRPPPPDVQITAEQALGPAVARLQMQFDSAEAYREFWRDHPAVGPYWSELVEEYIDYDLRSIDGALRPATRPEAMETNFLELGSTEQGEVIEELDRRGLPTTLLTSPRGLFDEGPPLYDAAWGQEGSARVPGFLVEEVADTNHYTILLGQGIPAVVAAIDALTARLDDEETTG